MDDLRLTVNGLDKILAGKNVLRHIDFSINAGEITALLGLNGAGKTTLVKTIIGEYSPSSGSVKIEGYGFPENRHYFGYMPQQISFLDSLYVNEVLDFVRHHYSSPYSTTEVCDILGISDLLNRKPSVLSGGQRRMVAFACAIIGRPKLLVLDEPTANLDLEYRASLNKYLHMFSSEGGSVLVTTHLLDEVEKIANKIVVIHKGTIRFSDSTAKFLAESAIRIIKVDGEYKEALRNMGIEFTESGNSICISTTDVDSLIEKISGYIPWRCMEIHKMSLEETLTESLK